LNRFILEESKKEGRKRKLEEQQKEAVNRDNNFAALTKLTGITPSSGSLAKHNIFEIVEELLETVKARQVLDEQRKQRICNRKMDINVKNGVRFQKAFAKYRIGTQLTREDLLALITKTKIPSDSANGRYYRELSLQWEE
jgi:hypothetical protein